MTEPAGPGAPSPAPQEAADGVVAEVDAIGLPCPQPVIELARAVKGLQVGERIRLLADDEAAWVDVPIWCRMQRQLLVSKERDGRLHTFVVERTT